MRERNRESWREKEKLVMLRVNKIEIDAIKEKLIKAMDGEVKKEF